MITNAKTLPKIYYGLHFLPGTAEYREPDKEPYRIFIGEEAIKNMNASFAGKPVYVHHVDEVKLDNLQVEADGYVVESFYNKNDGKTWAKFIVVSDKGHEAIAKGWKLSNAYVPKSTSSGGLCNGVEYDKEIITGEYEHLAIVPNPRYEESIVLTPEEFKAYNAKKELELSQLANSKETKGETMFFKKSKVENAKELEETSVSLPLSKKEMTVKEAIAIADKFENMQGYANGDHMVKVGNEEMTVNDLVKKHLEMSEKNDQDEQKEPALGNEEEKEEPKKEEPKEEVKKNENFEKLKNAESKAVDQFAKIELTSDKVARGKELF